MPNIASLRNYSKTRKTPRRSFEKERIDEELKLCGEFGLRAKKEVWRTKLVVAKLRKAARVLLTLDEKDPRRMFEGSAIIRQCRRIGVLDENQMKLDFVLSLTIANFLERRLQTQVYKLGLAKSIHHARVMIRQRHIRVGSQVVNIPQFCVRTESQKHIDFAPHSSLIVGAPPGRNLRKRRAADAAKKSGGGAAAAGDDE